jgi:hypothetical protein
MLPASGLYTVLLDPAGAAVGTATLSLQRVPGGPETPGTPGSERFTADLAAAGQAARFSFRGDAGGRVSLVTEADGRAEAAMPGGGAGGARRQDAALEPQPMRRARRLAGADAAGERHLHAAAGGDGRRRRQGRDHALPRAARRHGTVAVNGAPADLATVIPGQGMRVGFAGTAGSTVHLAVTADAALSSECYRVSLASPAGAPLSSAEGCDTSFTGGALTLPATGLYTVSLASVGTAVGGATIAVAAP